MSTKDRGQNTENQLRTFIYHYDTIYKLFTNQELGGTADRTEFKALLLEAYPKKFDQVVFRWLDRFSRERAMATLGYLKALARHGVACKSFTEPYLGSRSPLSHCFDAGHHRGPAPA